MRRLSSPFGRIDPRHEDGIALVLAIAVLAFLSAATATALYLATSSRSTANGSSAQQNAYALAQAGLSDALATLTGQIDSTGAIQDGATDPRDPSLLSTPRTVSYPELGGTVTYSGALDTSTYIWTITSTGSVQQQNSSTPITRMLSQKDSVVGINAGANGGSWSRFYQDDASPSDCLTLDATTWVTNLGTKGCLILKNGGTITGSSVNVDVGTTVTITGVQTASGPRSPTAASGWTNSTNANSNNSVYATAAAAAGNGTSASLKVTGFGFSIPSTASVNGIAVSVYRYATPLSEVQTITQTGTAPTGATFTINVCNTHTASIAYNASAATVATAINNACGSGYIACTGGALHSVAVTCTFSSTSGMTQMSTYSTSSGWSSNKPTYATSQNGGGVTLKDSSIYLLKSGAVPGGETNKASASTWPTSKGTATYGTASDLWGATWTPADVNGSTFGVQVTTTNTSAYSSETGNVDYVSVTVTYTTLPTAGVGSAATPVANLNVGNTCQLNSNTPHSPCSPADYTWATNTTTTAAADNPALIMPTVDFSYWYANAKPGPKHFCTNPNPGISPSFFDNDTTLNGSITVNGEMAGNTRSDPHGYSTWTYDSTTPSIDYDCQVWSGGGTKGTLLGRISWNHTTHVMNIKGTVFIDGAFRFDNDAQVIHYFGRGDLMSSREDEIDSLVCAGWSSGGTNTTDLGHSCIQNMASWDPTHNMMVLMADTAAPWNKNDQCGNAGEFPITGGCEEYDQGGTACSGGDPPTTICYYGNVPSGFQGILYSNSTCVIHQAFQDSGPVICERIYVPNGENANPNFFTFPYTGDLTDGQTYADTANASNFQIVPGQLGH